MTLHNFNRLNETEQIEAFWNGIFVGERGDGALRIICHQVNDFYVEYKILGGHYINMRTFKNPDRLQPYLSQIDISNLIG